jgi:predicted O-methyltransferase YrrM
MSIEPAPQAAPEHAPQAAPEYTPQATQGGLIVIDEAFGYHHHRSA